MKGSESMAALRKEKRLGPLRLFAHVKKLLRLVSGMRKWLVLFMLLSVFQAGLELTLPLIVRAAIDNYVTLPWLAVETSKVGDLLPGGIESVEDTSRGVVFVKRADLGRATLRALTATGATTTTGWMRTPNGKWLDEAELKSLDHERTKSLRVESLRGIKSFALLYAGLLLLIFVLAYAGTLGLGRIGQTAVLNMRLALWKKLLRLPVRYFDENPVGRIVTRVANDPANLSELFSSVLATVVADLAQFVGILVLFLWLDVFTTLWLLALAPMLIILTWWFKRISQKIYRRIRIHIAALNTFIQESFTALEVIKAFVFERHAKQRFDELNLANYRSQVSLVHVFAIFRPAVDALSTAGLALIVWYAGGRVLFQALSMGTFVAFILYLKMLFRPLQNLADKFNILQSSVVSTERLISILDEQEEPTGEVSAGNGQAMEVVFDNVSFSYDPRHPVLKGVSFVLKPGRRVALVGPTGSGKSTILALLLRFYELNEGQGSIKVGGVRIQNWNTRALRRMFALVPQDLFLFSSTLQENICLFRHECMDNLEHGLEVARLDRIIERLDGGLEHVLNERGTVLSQGERQLVSFARAVASARPCLVLDEATSSVDSATEELIQNAMEELLHQKTALVVAHRLSTIKDSDLILVLQNGTIIQNGTHQELMAEDGLYRKMYEVQFLQRNSGNSGTEV